MDSSEAVIRKKGMEGIELAVELEQLRGLFALSCEGSCGSIDSSPDSKTTDGVATGAHASY